MDEQSKPEHEAGEAVANKRGMDRLLALLFDEGRELINLSVSPGFRAHELTADEIADAISDWIEAVLRDEGRDEPPASGREQVHFREAIRRAAKGIAPDQPSS